MWPECYTITQVFEQSKNSGYEKKQRGAFKVMQIAKDKGKS